ncbi:DUF4209 domain-containing protein [Scytonema sp. PRP1]|uniref:DUF4209 domain-containing protein n=1 Tax=Scytonema sp. PRP1 TaxID=3120513 RepID=UPI002FD69EAE
MNSSKKTLENKLSELETFSGISEHEIESELRKLRDADIKEAPCHEWIYELLAFSFSENYTDQKTSWGTYFGPTMVRQTDDGKMIVSPSIQRVDEKAIAYWNQRSQSTNNPLLQARYAGLVWDLSEKTTGKKPHYSAAVRCCEALLKIAEDKIHKYNVDVIQKLERALFIATSLKNQKLIENAKQTILNYERFVAEDSKPGLWGFSFDLLVGNGKVNLSGEEEKEIVDTLEARLQRLKNGKPRVCEYAAERLARYYRAKGLEEECSRVIRTLGCTFESAANNAAPLAASSWLEHMHHVYIQFNLANDAERVARTIRELGLKVRDDMKAVSHEMEISRDEFEAYVEQMLDGDLEQALARIVIRYIPRRGEIENQLYDLAKQAPLSFLFAKQITDHQGRVVAAVGSLEDDLDGNVVNQMSQNMASSVIFLSSVLDEAIRKFSLNCEGIVNYLFQAPIFTSNQKVFLSKGIQAYLEKDYMIAVHLLIPQIEAAVRNLVEMSGGAVLKRGRGGGFHVRTLDEILRSEQVIQSLDEDGSLYFRVVLTDQRGWNIRNDVCHGLSLQDHFSKGVADRLIHILLVLAQLRIREV